VLPPQSCLSSLYISADVGTRCSTIFYFLSQPAWRGKLRSLWVSCTPSPYHDKMTKHDLGWRGNGCLSSICGFGVFTTIQRLSRSVNDWSCNQLSYGGSTLTWVRFGRRAGWVERASTSVMAATPDKSAGPSVKNRKRSGVD
jgi:hypothetical protein